jgi:3-dehydroquinate synthase
LVTRLDNAIETYFLENAKKTTLLHGEAIAVGMILEGFISKEKKLISEAEYLDLKNTLNNIFEPIVIEENEHQNIIDLLIHDKKNEYGKVQFALLDGIGNITINQTSDNETIIKAFADYKS